MIQFTRWFAEIGASPAELRACGWYIETAINHQDGFNRC